MKIEGFGERLRAFRKGEKLSQEEFARRIGVTRGVVSDYEQGKYTPNLDVFVNMLFETGLTFQWLVFGNRADEHSSSAINLEALKQAIVEAAVIDGALEDLPPEKKVEAQARAISAIYNKKHLMLS